MADLSSASKFPQPVPAITFKLAWASASGSDYRIDIRALCGGSNDEKLAERFAGRVLEAIRGLASK